MVDYGDHSNKPDVPLNAGNFLTRWETISFSRRALLQEIGQFVIVFCRIWDAFFPPGKYCRKSSCTL